jgi:hypothetical protein
MNRKLLKQLQQKFGSSWACSCKAPLDPTKFEILTETEGTIIANYICPSCNREQLIHAALEETNDQIGELASSEVKKFISLGPISADEVLEIREEIRLLKEKSLYFPKEAKPNTFKQDAN